MERRYGVARYYIFNKNTLLLKQLARGNQLIVEARELPLGHVGTRVRGRRGHYPAILHGFGPLPFARTRLLHDVLLIPCAPVPLQLFLHINRLRRLFYGEFTEVQILSPRE